jgi:aminotransferase
MQIDACLRQFPDSINLSKGDYNFSASQTEGFKNYFSQVLDKPQIYLQSAGQEELRAKIAKEYGLQMNNVCVTEGGMHALYCLLWIFRERGSDVIIGNPVWEAYRFPTKVTDGVLIKVDYSTNENILEHILPGKTRVVILNNPENPTTVTYGFEKIKELAKELFDKNVPLIVDEVYRKIRYDGTELKSCAELIHDFPNVAVVESFSKAYAMTGWRVGYILADESVIEKLKIDEEGNPIRGTITSVPEPSQYAAIYCLDNQKDIIPWVVGKLKKRRDALYPYLRDIKGLKVKEPTSTIYFWIDHEEFSKDDVKIGTELIKKKHIGTVFGSIFGSRGQGCQRLSFGNIDDSRIDECGEKFVDFFNSFNQTL